MNELVLNDGKKVEAADGELYGRLLEELPQAVRAKTVAFRHGGRLRDVRDVICEGGDVEPVLSDSNEGLEILRHSTSHLMALAVQQLFEKVRFAIGPAVSNGFYYDFLFERTFTPDDLGAIEKKMKELAKDKNLKFSREEMPRREAITRFEESGQRFKVELLEELEEDTVSIFTLGTFTDLCRGPHLPSLRASAFKLTSLAGAYWRGDEKRDMLQRIYGTAFPNKDDLKAEIERREEAKKRDHRKLGPQLGLFDIIEDAGGGLAFWYPKGYLLREIVETFWKDEHRRNGYEVIMTPHIAKSSLWKTSGHFNYYKENMFVIRSEDQDFVLKPMNCPGHILMYKSKLHSYRDLPVRYAELGTVYRNERSGTLHGLLRVRGFTQDDAHIFCTPEQLNEEVGKCFDFAHHMLTSFGFHDYKVELSAHDPDNMDKYAGTEEEWIKAEDALLDAIETRDIPYEKMPGEAVFYGPKIDIKLIDAIGRGWQATTIQFDFNLPRRFEVQYVTSEGNKEYVYMIHRALLGSIERFIGTLTEHYAGEFPLWLAPVQVRILPIGKDHHDYAEQVHREMQERGVRVEADLREEKIGYKIREAELAKIPYMVIVGDKEIEEKSLSVRSKKRGRLGEKKIDEFITELVDEADRKA